MIRVEDILAVANRIYTDRKFGKHQIEGVQALIMPSDQIYALASALCDSFNAEIADLNKKIEHVYETMRKQSAVDKD